MAKEYHIYRDAEGSCTLCRDAEHDGNLTTIREPLASGIKDVGVARLLAQAPVLLAACARALTALKTVPKFPVPELDDNKEKVDSYQITNELRGAIKAAEAGKRTVRDAAGKYMHGEPTKYTIYTRHPDDGVVKSAVMMWRPELLDACMQARDWIAANAGQTERTRSKEEILALLDKAIDQALTQH